MDSDEEVSVNKFHIKKSKPLLCGSAKIVNILMVISNYHGEKKTPGKSGFISLFVFKNPSSCIKCTPFSANRKVVVCWLCVF